MQRRSPLESFGRSAVFTAQGRRDRRRRIRRTVLVTLFVATVLVISWFALNAAGLLR